MHRTIVLTRQVVLNTTKDTIPSLLYRNHHHNSHPSVSTLISSVSCSTARSSCRHVTYAPCRWIQSPPPPFHSRNHHHSTTTTLRPFSTSFVTTTASTTIPIPSVLSHASSDISPYPQHRQPQQQHHNKYHFGIRLENRYFSTTSPPPPPPSDGTKEHSTAQTSTSTDESPSAVTASADTDDDDDVTVDFVNDETKTTDGTDTSTSHPDTNASNPAASTETPSTIDSTSTPEEIEDEKRKLARLAKEWGVTGYDNEEDNPGEEDDSPPDDNDEDMYGSMGKMLNPDTSQHRSTNIGVPTRPEDPVPVDGKTVHVMFCYSKYEIMEGTRFEDNVGQFHLPLTYDAIVKEACEFYNEDATSEYFSLEYYHQKRWHPLTEDCYDILLHYHKEQIIHQEDYQTLFFIRLPFMYDTSDYPDEDPNGGMGDFNSLTDAAMGNLKGGKLPNPPPTVQDKIIQILQRLRKNKIFPHPDSPSPYDRNADIMHYRLTIPHSYLDGEDQPEEENDGEQYDPIVVSTRDFVLDGCRTDYDLRDILLLNVNALSHMVKCIHYDIYWKFPLPKRQDIDAALQEDVEVDVEAKKHLERNEYKHEHDDDFDYSHKPEDGHDHSHSHEHSAACRH